ncbi:MAG: hypothetical protein WCV93_02745 [Candidatus Shapirobacteria bacterium]|jgi:hypothetical protein
MSNKPELPPKADLYRTEEHKQITQMVSDCMRLGPGLRVIFNLKIGTTPTSVLEAELRTALEVAGILGQQEETCQLTVQSPFYKHTYMDTDFGAHPELLDENRNPFRQDRQPDRPIGSTYDEAGVSRPILVVNPTGRLASLNVQTYNLVATAIAGISFSTDQNLPLSPALSDSGKIVPVQSWE